MNPSHRIVLNTAATYTRSVLGAGLALFSSRWVLAALGQSDYGLFSVVASIIIFITFLNTTMAVSVARSVKLSERQRHRKGVLCLRCFFDREIYE